MPGPPLLLRSPPHLSPWTLCPHGPVLGSLPPFPPAPRAASQLPSCLKQLPPGRAQPPPSCGWVWRSESLRNWPLLEEWLREVPRSSDQSRHFQDTGSIRDTGQDRVHAARLAGLGCWRGPYRDIHMREAGRRWGKRKGGDAGKRGEGKGEEVEGKEERLASWAAKENLLPGDAATLRPAAGPQRSPPTQKPHRWRWGSPAAGRALRRRKSSAWMSAVSLTAQLTSHASQGGWPDWRRPAWRWGLKRWPLGSLRKEFWSPGGGPRRGLSKKSRPSLILDPELEPNTTK